MKDLKSILILVAVLALIGAALFAVVSKNPSSPPLQTTGGANLNSDLNSLDTTDLDSNLDSQLNQVDSESSSF